jgi:bifunctional DNase/RNase
LPTSEDYKKLNWMQKIALYEGIASDKADTYDVIKEVLKELKPWLDKEMYFKLEEMKDNTRINAKWGGK